MGPLVKWLSSTSQNLTNRVPEGVTEKTFTFSRDQLRKVLSLDSQTVDLGTTEKKIIHNIFNFGELTAEQCMVPLVQMTAIKDTSNLQEAHEIANDSGFSR